MTTKKLLSSKMLIPIGISIFAIPVGFLGCGGGGGGGGVATDAAEVNATTVADALDWFEGTVPGCQVNAAAASAPVREAASGMRVLSELFTMVSDVNNLPAARASALAAQTFAGDCGGTLTVDSVHNSGITTFTLTFSNFCSTDDSVTPPQQSMATGVVTAQEIGTPGDTGPTVTSATVATDQLTLVSNGETSKLAVNNATMIYGVPGVWDPGIPTAANPDQVTVGQATVTFETQGRTHTISNVAATRHESGDTEIINITGGRYATSTHGYVNVTTSEPLVVNLNTGILISGAMQATGANGATATVTASGAGDGKLTVEVDGTPVGGVDCSGAQDMLLGLI